MDAPFITEATEPGHYDIETPRGRSNLFRKRIEELTKPKEKGGPGLTMDQAIFEMRTSTNSDDVALLAAMGDAPSKVRSEKLHQQRHSQFLTQLADENAQATTPSPEVAAAIKLATNERWLAFDARIDEIMTKGLTFDQAIDHMRANATDARLLASMGGSLAEENVPSAEVAAAMKLAANSANERKLAFNARIDEIMAEGFTLDQALNRMRGNAADRRLLASMGG